MSRDKYNMLQYTVALVSEFSAHFGISQQQALNYLVRFKGGGVAHLEEFYNILHTHSFNDSIDALAKVCRNNGGRL